MQKTNKLLVALLKDTNDLKILINQNWYRIPADKKSTPIMVRDGSIKYIAFYQGKIFKTDGFQIKYYAKVKNIEKVKRKELFPNEPENLKTDNLYYKITTGKLFKLENPIISNRKRVIIFINSELNKLKTAIEINDLYLGTRIEEKMWDKLKENEIPAEREYHQKIQDNHYFIDFALFCKRIKLALECDGDRYHLNEKDVKYDKSRDNNLKSKGWNVLRYTNDEINYKIEDVVIQLQDTINEYGGIANNDKTKFYPIKKDNNQEAMF